MPWIDLRRLASSAAFGLVACAASPSAPPPARLPPPSSAPVTAGAHVAGDGACHTGTVGLKILGLNDFHGQLSPGKKRDGRAAGGAAVLASYLHAATQGHDDRWLLVHAGDLVGASPPSSALLQDEPTIDFFNLLANRSCTGSVAESACNVVATFGNHEFDEGRAELMRLIHGGNHPKGPFLDNPYPGARFPYVSANVVDAATGKGLLDAFTIVRVGGVRVGVVGAVLQATPTMVTPSGVAGLHFLPEAESVNRAVASLKQAGVHAIVLAIHQGGDHPGYEGPTRPDAKVEGNIVDIVRALDDDVDVVVSGHWHGFTNAFVPTASGKRVLVTQAYSAGTAYADIDVTVDCASDDITAATARIVPTYADSAPGTTPDAAAAQLVQAAENATKPMTSRVVATTAVALTSSVNADGESLLGQLIADSERASMTTDVAFMNPGGVRADVDAGPVTWGQLFAVEPFGNDLVALKLSGSQILALLESQWDPTGGSRILLVSGITYTWDAARPAGARVSDVKIGGKRLVPGASYSVAVNSFMADGGDQFNVFKTGTDRRVGGGDLDALIAYLAKLPSPAKLSLQRRIKRVH